MSTQSLTQQKVKEYYGQVLKRKQDLQTSACCTADALPAYLRETAQQLPDEIQEKFYGCGSPIPPALEGCTVLDLGCGTGRDSYLLSKLVGPNGRVIGVDMTEEQLVVARRYLPEMMKKFEYFQTNVEFHQGYIEDLASIGIEDSSVDVVVSNCVINLSPDKAKVFSEIFRVLKPGGELYFSDVFADRRIPQNLAEDPVLLGECLGGALYIEDFRRLLAGLGCLDYRTVDSRPISLHERVRQKTGRIQFSSQTIRTFKLDLEDRCEDYGQVAFYLGTVPESPHYFELDDHHLLESGKPLPVCSNTAAMLGQTRYRYYFRVEGDLRTHYGLFDCGTTFHWEDSDKDSRTSCC